MTEAGQRLIESMDEALAIARSEHPAHRVHIQGHAYVPEERVAELESQMENLRATLLTARDALYNGFEPDNQSRAYKAVDAAISRLNCKSVT